MGNGNGAEKVVWAQSVIEEAQGQRGRHTASVLIDLAKAYERVPLERVWSRGLAKGFPPRILALGLEICSFARRLVYRGAVSDEARTLTALLAGMGMASDMLYLVLSEPIDSILSINSNLHVCLVADDIKVMVHEAEVQRTAKKLDDITGHLSEMIEGEMGRKMSKEEEGKKGKTVAVASSRSVGIAVAERMQKRGIGVKGKVKNLWVDFVAGGRRKRGRNTTLLGRHKAARKKQSRASRLGRKIAPNITRAAIITSITYGAAFNGVTEEQLGCMTKMAARAYAKMHGRSATAMLLMEDVDPTYVV